MRNLKRALSLTLASVMLLGMMVVGSSAAGYPDVDDEDNVEAIEVLQAVKVMQGDDNGNFRPDDSVSRAEMAVVMALLLDLDYEYYEASCPFNDVPDWARPYVGACYANKIVSGYSATTYGANDSVTAVQAASMMMRALGYFQYDVDYADGFETSTVRQGTSIGIFDGVGSSASAAMTRNQVAQMALNALQCGTVEPSDSAFSITTPDGFTVSQGRTNYVYVVGRDNTVATAINKTQASTGHGNDGLTGAILDLGEKLYNGDLRKSAVTDGFKAPATRWSYKNTEIGTYTDAEDYKLEGTVKSSAMYATVGKTVAENYEWIVRMDGRDTNTSVDDAGKALFGQAQVADNNSENLAGTGNGTVTYIYLDNTAHGSYSGYAYACIVSTYGAEVTKVKDGKITLDDRTRQLEVEASGYAEGDVVLYTRYADGTSWKVGTILGRAELVEAEANTVRADKFVTIGDKTYNYNIQFNDKNGDKLAATYAGQNVALYLDGQGNIVYLGEAKEGTDYALVMGVGRSAQYNQAKPLYGAELLFADGTNKNVLLDKDLTDSILNASDLSKWARVDEPTKSEDDIKLKKIQTALVGKVFAYTENKSGSFDLSMQVGTKSRTVNFGKDIDGAGFRTNNPSLWSDKTASKGGKISNSDFLKNGKASVDLTDFVTLKDVTRLSFNNDTIFILHDSSDGTFDFNTYTGYKNVPDLKLTENSTVSVYNSASGVARVVFITNAVLDTAKDVVFIVGDKGAKEEKTGTVTYKNYKAVVNGEVTTVNVKTGDALSAVEALGDDIGIFTGITINEDGYVTKLKSVEDTDKVLVNGVKKNFKAYTGTKTESKGTYILGGETYAASENAIIVYYGEYDNNKDTLHIETRLNNDTNDKAYVVTDDGDVIAIFVIEVPDKGSDDNKGPDYAAEGIKVPGTDKGKIEDALNSEEGKANVTGNLSATGVSVGNDQVLNVNGNVSANVTEVGDGAELNVGKNIDSEKEIKAVSGTVNVTGEVKGTITTASEDAEINVGGATSGTINATEGGTVELSGGLANGGTVKTGGDATATINNVDKDGKVLGSAKVEGAAETKMDATGKATITVTESEDEGKTEITLTDESGVDEIKVPNDTKAVITVPTGTEEKVATIVTVGEGADVTINGTAISELKVNKTVTNARETTNEATIEVNDNFGGTLTVADGVNATIIINGDVTGSLTIKDATVTVTGSIDGKNITDEEINAASVTSEGKTLGALTELAEDTDVSEITLLKDVTLASALTLTSNLTLNLNGKEIVAKSGCIKIGNGTTAAVVTINGSGTITGNTTNVTPSYPIFVEHAGTLNISKATVTGYDCIMVGQNCTGHTSAATLNVTDCTLTSNGNTCVVTNGLDVDVTHKITIKDSTLTNSSASEALYLPAPADVSIVGGRVSAQNAAIGIKSGKLNISGGAVIESTGTKTNNGNTSTNGIYTNSAAIYVDSNTSYKGDMEITVNGATLKTAAAGPVIQEISANGTATEIVSLKLTNCTLISGTGAQKAIDLVTDSSNPSDRTVSVDKDTTWNLGDLDAKGNVIQAGAGDASEDGSGDEG